MYKLKKQVKAVFIRNKVALELATRRAAAENRTAANAAETTIIEALSKRYGRKHTVSAPDSQGENLPIIPKGGENNDR